MCHAEVSASVVYWYCRGLRSTGRSRFSEILRDAIRGAPCPPVSFHREAAGEDPDKPHLYETAEDAGKKLKVRTPVTSDSPCP